MFNSFPAKSRLNSKFVGFQTLIDNYYHIIRPLLRQPLIVKSNRIILITWSFIALVLVSSFSGSILSFTIVKEKYPVDSIEDLIKLKDIYPEIIAEKNSRVFWEFKANLLWNIKLNFKMDKIIDRMKYITSNVRLLWLFFWNYLDTVTRFLNKVNSNGWLSIGKLFCLVLARRYLGTNGTITLSPV